jgi:arylsulfate sulfotransferase
MNTKTTQYSLSRLFLIFSLFSASCSKDSKIIPPVPVPVDTLTQNVYTINSAGTASPGVILTAPFPFPSDATAVVPGLLLIMDQDGKVLKKQTTPGSAFDFTRWTINGQVRYSYIMNDPGAFRAIGLPYYTGYAVITDSNLNQLQTANFIPAGPGPFQPQQELDVHDFILLGDNHYITESTYPKYVTNIPAYLNPSPRVQVEVPVIEEVNNGSVVWYWDPSSDTSFYGNSVQGNIYSDSTVSQDYIHLNSMVIDPTDNNLILSFRDQCQVIKVNRQTGATMWRLGGKNSDFPLFSDQAFLYQHDATLVDSNQTLLLFDDGDAILRPESRILEFKLDELNKVVTRFKSFTVPEPWTDLMGAVQKMGDEYFIGGGTSDYMLEVNYVTGQKIREFLGTEPSYRSFKYLTGTTTP